MNLIEKHSQIFSINQGINTLEVWNIFDQILGLQLLMEICGDVLEIGVLQGATISFLAKSLQENERAFLIDPYQNLESIKQLVSSFAEVSTEQIFTLQLDSLLIAKRHAHLLGRYNPSFRFIHIDGEHSYDAVYSDIELSYKYLAPGGIIVLDDIFNIASACCTHAMFDYLKINPNLHCVAIGCNKAFLCTSKDISTYRNFFLNLPNLLAEVADLHIRLCFNSWSYERSYVTFHSINKDEPKYQVINKICSSLQEATDYLGLNIY
ncbi:class I SAM-dependent methyltransferase [Nodularia spumigena]|uniref:class I SAM-dependent methyltransferase n=1 Tax=Nodularia spumigena TaxID=70799 RepID=UPI000D3033F6|nr:class I SAM-dependent methyltransferase [Nodularia spumigena]